MTNSPPIPALLWPQRSPTNAIAPGEIHLWAWTFGEANSPSDADLAILDEQERKRTARFYFAPDKVRFSLCHANMRRILASYLQRQPESLSYREADGGKPGLLLNASDPQLRFNLSHSKSIGLLSVGLDLELGVDVEDIRPIERDVAERFFSSAEIASLTPLRGEAWLNGFYRCWTRKEAILKAEGLGLRIPLDSFDVSLQADEAAALLDARPEAKLTANWRLHHLVPANGAVAALAANVEAQIITSSLVVAQ